MENAIQSNDQANHDNNITVIVKYITASKQFIEAQANRNETLGALKTSALEFFSLREDGTKTYQLLLNGVVQNDMSITLGSLAESEHELRFNLAELLKAG